MTDTLSIRLKIETKKRLEKFAQRSRRSKSVIAAEAIAQYLDTQDWQVNEIHLGIDDLDEGRVVSHEKVTKWLQTWGERSESKAPR